MSHSPQPPSPPPSAQPPSADRVLVRVPVPTVSPRWTFIFLAANVLVYVIQLVLWVVGGRGAANLVTLLGAKDNASIVAGEYWRLITPIFLHAGLLHLAFNSYALYILGPQVEAPFGYARFLIIYLLSGISGSLASFWFNPDPSVGASGAIFGLIGALGVYLYRHRRAFGEFGRRRLNNIIVIILINLAIGLQPQIDNWGHLGGLVGGVVLAWLIGPDLKLERDLAGTARVVDFSSKIGPTRQLAVFAFVLALVAGTLLGVMSRR